MTCVVCDAQRRDVNDVEQRIAELIVDQRRCWDPIQKDFLALEIRALEAAKKQFEGKFLKHRNSARHL